MRSRLAFLLISSAVVVAARASGRRPDRVSGPERAERRREGRGLGAAVRRGDDEGLARLQRPEDPGLVDRRLRAALRGHRGQLRQRHARRPRDRQGVHELRARLEWKASKGGNSGVMYGVVEDPKYKAAWMTGPEYQFIDDVGFPQKLEDVAEGRRQLRDAPAERPEAAEAGGRVEQHADRGERQARRALAERQEDPRVRALERRRGRSCATPASGRTRPDYGSAAKGRIVLQDHGSAFWFRNVKLRPLP